MKKRFFTILFAVTFLLVSCVHSQGVSLQENPISKHNSSGVVIDEDTLKQSSLYTSDKNDCLEDTDDNNASEEDNAGCGGIEEDNDQLESHKSFAPCPNLVISNHISRNMKIGYDFNGLRYIKSSTRCSTGLIKPFDYDLIIKAVPDYKFKIFIASLSDFACKANAYFIDAEWNSECVVPSSSSFIITIARNDDSIIEYYDDYLQFDFNFDYYMDSELNVYKIKQNRLGYLKYHQSFCVYNDCYYSTDGRHIAIQDSHFNVIRNVDLHLGHGNSFQLGNSHYAYVSGWCDNKVYVVDLETLELTNTICLPTSCYTTVAVDEENGLFYIFQRETEPSTYSFYNLIVFDYINCVIKSTKKTNLYLYAQQSTIFVNKSIYLSAGLGGLHYNGLNYFMELDCELNVASSIVINSLKNLEPEGIFYDGNSLLVSFIDCGVYSIEIQS